MGIELTPEQQGPLASPDLDRRLTSLRLISNIRSEEYVLVTEYFKAVRRPSDGPQASLDGVKYESSVDAALKIQ